MRTVIVIAVTLLLSACGSSTRAGGRLDVVAAENVYGNIASQIGGPHVSVTSLLTSPTADPHLFEPSTSSGLAVADAKVVLQNGLGYDAFMTRLENAAPSKDRVVVTMADVLGIHGTDANPHLWYDVPKLDRIAMAIAAAFPGRIRRTRSRTAAASTASSARSSRCGARSRRSAPASTAPRSRTPSRSPATSSRRPGCGTSRRTRSRGRSRREPSRPPPPSRP